MKILAGKFRLAIWAGLVLAAISVRADTTPVTTTEATAFARQLANHFNRNDRMYYVRAFDFDALMDKGVPKEMQGDSEIDDFKRGMRLGLELQMQLPKSLKFLEATQADGQCCVLMRLLLTNNTVNYQSLYLEHDRTNGVKVSDVYIFLSAEKLSDNIRHLSIPLLQAKNRSLLDRMFGDTPDLVKYAPQWQRMTELMRHGQYQEVLNAYDELPDSLKREKFLLVQRLQAAQRVNQTEYLNAITFWRETYPNDPSLDLMSIDYYTLLKQYDKALESIDRLDKAVGGDPWLDVNRAAMYSLQGDKSAAEKMAKRAFDREPDLTVAGLFTVSLMEQRSDFAACVNMLEEMHEKGGYRLTSLDRGLRSNPKNEPLLDSGEYKKWFFSVNPNLNEPEISPAKPAN